MQIGTCRLCLTPDAELHASHFVPRALYKRFIERGLAGEPPVSASPTKSMFSSKQASDYLLCGDCEQRFNLGGEKWTLAHCWRDPTNFPLRSHLLEAGAAPYSFEDFTIFETVSIPGVDREKLVYFGASVIWRAAVHKWHMPAGDPLLISLGPYEEAFRRYLMGETGFPDNAAMLVIVSHSMDDMNNKFVTFPWVFKREGGYHQIKLIVPGITYQLCVGKLVPAATRRACAAKSEKGLVYMTEATDKINMQANLAMLKNSQRVGKLAKTGGVIAGDTRMKR